MVWVVGPILAVILFVFLVILICVLRKRKQNTKQPLEQGAVLTPLMAGFDMNNAGVVAGGGGGGGVGPGGVGGADGVHGVPPVAVNGGNGVMVPTDPVELRRINFQAWSIGQI